MEVDWGRLRSTDFKKIFVFFGRPDGFGSSDFVRIEIFLCSIDLYWFREPILLKLCFVDRARVEILRFLQENIVQLLAQPRFQLIWGSIGFRGPDVIKIMNFWAGEGSMFDDFVAEKID